MRNNIINKISPTARLICLFILIICLFVAKSIFLILFITTLTVILMLITGKKVNIYVNIIKKLIILLLFLLIVYIIMFEYNIFNLLIFACKLIIMTLLFAIFDFNTDFSQLHQAIYGCLKPLEKIKINVEKFSLDIVIALLFLKSLINNKQNILEIQNAHNKRQLTLKGYILPIIINSANELNDIQIHLKTKFYKLSYRKNNRFSNVILIIFAILFIFVIFKEVIL